MKDMINTLIKEDPEKSVIRELIKIEDKDNDG